jgi:hypothetical protein
VYEGLREDRPAAEVRPSRAAPETSRAKERDRRSETVAIQAAARRRTSFNCCRM